MPDENPCAEVAYLDDHVHGDFRFTYMSDIPDEVPIAVRIQCSRCNKMWEFHGTTDDLMVLDDAVKTIQKIRDYSLLTGSEYAAKWGHIRPRLTLVQEFFERNPELDYDRSS